MPFFLKTFTTVQCTTPAVVQYTPALESYYTTLPQIQWRRFIPSGFIFALVFFGMFGAHKLL